MLPDTPFSRRTLLRTGAGAAAGAYAAQLTILETDAAAALLQPGLKRSTWLALDATEVSVTADGVTTAAQLTAVADLPIADQIPQLRGHDAAFVVRLMPERQLPSAIYTLRAPGMDPIDLAFGPVDAGARTLEAVVDRTVRIAGVNEEGAPLPSQVSAARAALPTASASPAVKRPRLQRATLHQGRTARRSSLALDLRDTRDVVAVRVSLLSSRGTLLASAFSSKRTPHRIKLALRHRRRLAAADHRLIVRLTLRDGSVTTVRASARPQ